MPCSTAASTDPPATIRMVDLQAQYRRIEADVQARIAAVLAHGQFIGGPEIVELEARLADYVGVAHGIAVSSGTDALLVALLALGVGPGDEVVTTPFTFVATVEVIALLGARPVFVDIDPATYNLDPALLAAAITPRTRAILPVSLYGQCADLDAINAVAARHGLPVIEDAAQSLGASYRGRRSGGLCHIGCTSFFPSKPLGCYGDGGACFTDDAALATAMRQIREHGQDRRYHHARLGINGRLDSLQAAVLLAKLAIFDDEVARRGRIGGGYSERLQGQGAHSTASADNGLLLPHIAPGCSSVYAQYTIQVDTRDAVQAALSARGIPTAVHYPVPLNAQPAYASYCCPDCTPVAARAAERVLSLPMHPYLTDAELDAVVAALLAAIADSAI